MDFQIANTTLSHQYDLECFSKRVDHLFDCHENEEERKKYGVPYFCFVQSSGMGKTKILWDYQNKPDDPKTDPNTKVISFVVIPTHPMTDNDPIFPVLDIDQVGPFLPDISQKTPAEFRAHIKEVFRNVSASLDKTLKTLVNNHLKKHPGTTIRRVALLFDESQQLLKEENGYDAFRFRCIRRWLMEKPTNKTFRTENKLIVVGVFSGTSSKLTNVLFENDEDLSNETEAPSRNLPQHQRQYYEKGPMLHSPFWQTTTTGSCLYLLKEPWKLSEYTRAIYYGRPLFALMEEKGILHGKTQAILFRMLHLHLHKDWALKYQIGLINVLSSRVQLGQVSVEMASDLVANSFANLCACNEDSSVVHLGYFPDPVLARLAMCMMDEDFLIEVEAGKNHFIEIQGKNKEWWSNELKNIFSNEMVRLDKGNGGEIFVALYMLYCGDRRLRKVLNEIVKQQKSGIQAYSQFSVSLDDWLQLLLSGGNFPNGQGPDPSNEDCKASVGFIQVCRNPLRSHSGSWKSQAYLKYIYESGIGFFTCDQLELIDMVIPIRIKSNEEGNTDGFCYVPMLISIKSHEESCETLASEFWKEVDERLNKDGISRAVCLLIVFGSNENTKSFEGQYAIQKTSKISEDLIHGGVIQKAIQVPYDDMFGLSAAFDSMLPTAQLNAGMFASHPFLKAHGSNASCDLNAENALHSKAPKFLKTQHDALHTSLKTGLLGNNPQDSDSTTTPASSVLN